MKHCKKTTNLAGKTAKKEKMEKSHISHKNRYGAVDSRFRPKHGLLPKPAFS